MTVRVCMGDGVTIMKDRGSFIFEVENGYDIINPTLSKDAMVDLISKMEDFVECGTKDSIDLVSIDESIAFSIERDNIGFTIKFENDWVYESINDFITFIHLLKVFVQ